MSFLTKLKSGLGKISLKRKPGGTMVGNLIRGLVHKQTDGALGNGAMMQQEGETTSDANQRMVKGFGAASVAFSDNASQGVHMREEPESETMHSFKSGAITEKIMGYAKKFALPVFGGIAALFAIKFFAKKSR